MATIHDHDDRRARGARLLNGTTRYLGGRGDEPDPFGGTRVPLLPGPATPTTSGSTIRVSATWTPHPKATQAAVTDRMLTRHLYARQRAWRAGLWCGAFGALTVLATLLVVAALILL